ncbi:ubiquitin-protein ligase E3A-like isoform X1 [Penaeus japonicus]|uniref:ubiquitin-protein ligase E3A-like isoform X1 n=2 Tax=Penaeus japonicus TaxID=27405 RepID=UPI001C715E6D|nr:ubiquitin-protein ligase E3A-like isoform X1 [Penaeus japonicus]
MSSPEESPETSGAGGGTRSNSLGHEEVQSSEAEQDGRQWPSQHQGGDMKRAAAQLIEKYYFQLTDGCGNPNCDNPNCASSGKTGPLSSNEAAGKALQLFAARARLCEAVSAKVPRSSQSRAVAGGVDAASVEGHSSVTGNTPTSSLLRDVNMAGASAPTTPLPPLSPQVDGPVKTPGLTEAILSHSITECRNANNYAKLRRLLWSVFSNEVALRHSFLKSAESDMKNEAIQEKNDKESGAQSKEELRAQEGDLDKDLDCAEVVCVGEDATCSCNEHERERDKSESREGGDRPVALDVSEVRRAYSSLFECPEEEFFSTLMNAIVQLLSDSISIQLRAHRDAFIAIPNNINIFIILLESPALNTTDYIEGVMPELCRTVSQLPEMDQALLTRHLATWDGPRLRRLLESLHQLITIKLLTTEFNRDFTINDEDSITSATQVMKLLYYASILGGELDTPLLSDLPPEEPNVETMPVHDDPFLGVSSAGKDWATRAPPKDSLGTELGIHVLDARIPLVPLSEFYDDFLSDQLEMDRDFAYYKAGSGDKFSFLHYPFILTPATKALGLYYDNRIRMYSERRMSIYQQVMEGMPANPYLKLRVRRDHIIDDALVELEMVALENPGDLKKQLVVEFEGEQGIDEGGVSKEFFQLIVEQIFNPDYAMFCRNNETRTFWFNPNCFESDAQFTLVGIVLGLAIYNNVILDVHFPPVMYKKLCSKPGSFHDLRDWNTTLYRSLVELLEYEGEDMEDVFMQTFRVGYQDVFGTSLTHDLKADGGNIFVNQSSKHEFVELYADFLLNKMVERQFRAFRRGFNMVTDDSPLANLFRPEELELLVCGSQHYDFLELMKSAEYDGGYSSETAIVQAFWELVHDMSTEDKKKLLQFTTGSARVPVGGLARLKLIIARNGPDCDRLPTAHTCFNVLLLPEYSSKEKLKDRLYKAIKYSQGFGML